MKKLFILVTVAVSIVALVSCSSSKKGTSGTTPLAGTFWKLVYAGNTPYNPPPGVRLVSMKLNDSTKNITGFLGCNNLAGNYILSGKDGITFTVISTKMACPPGDAMKYESAFAEALNKANKYKIDGNKLALFDGDTFVAAFVAEK